MVEETDDLWGEEEKTEAANDSHEVHPNEVGSSHEVHTNEENTENQQEEDNIWDEEEKQENNTSERERESNNNNEEEQANYEDVFGSDDEGPAAQTGIEAMENIPVVQMSDIPRPDDEDTLCYIRLPASMAIEKRPFDPDTIEDDETGKEVIRWRYVTGSNGDVQTESNTRMIKWSDGSETLHVGASVFDISIVAMHDNKNQIFARSLRSSDFIQSHGPLKKKILLKPSSSQSEIKQKTAKKIQKKLLELEKAPQQITILRDANAEMEELRRLEDDRIKRKNKSVAKQKRDEKGYGKELSTEFIEPTEEVEYEGEEDAFAAPTQKRKRRAGDSSGSSESSSSEDESSGSDSSEAEVVVHNKARAKRNAIGSDSDD